MAMWNDPIATFRKSELRKPEVVDRALHGPVEILVSASKSLLMISTELIDQVDDAQNKRDAAHEQLRRLMQTQLVLQGALRRGDVSPLLLGDVGFIASWAREEQERFAEGFAEALAESLRTNDPAAAAGFLTVMSTRRRSIDRPSAPWDAEEHDALLPERVRSAPSVSG